MELNVDGIHPRVIPMQEGIEDSLTYPIRVISGDGQTKESVSNFLLIIARLQAPLDLADQSDEGQPEAIIHRHGTSCAECLDMACVRRNPAFKGFLAAKKQQAGNRWHQNVSTAFNHAHGFGHLTICQLKQHSV